ncbi:hypothetical protein K6119_11380 [Paracrocinitomix mangrovi]|uniref:hypothetical protein n=1 Tax=Paracrocinitomix mangrovi TaxID=2862509 RepID=UPI001EDC1DCF|nr:hypothetical protein [Paracrocinitomix mangrovi]UKN00336.1 hypothetical protein K6119_11380 [Paracrocinitomix mangrovi]
MNQKTKLNKILRTILLVYIGIWIILGIYGLIADVYYEVPYAGYLTVYAIIFGLFLGGGFWLILYAFDRYRKSLEK